MSAKRRKPYYNRYGKQKLTKALIVALLGLLAGFGGYETVSTENTNQEQSTEVSSNDSQNQQTTSEQSSETISNNTSTDSSQESSSNVSSIENIPEYDGTNGYVTINDNTPDFDSDHITNVSYEAYSSLDSYGRVGTAEACLGRDLMPTEERGDISSVHPSGWYSLKAQLATVNKYANRGHLIAFSLAGENANEENLASMTPYCNQEVFTEFEEKVRNYIYQTNNHVMYRVVPIYDGTNSIAKAFQIEAYSVEDGGEGVSFNVVCYNVEPGLTINYS